MSITATFRPFFMGLAGLALSMAAQAQALRFEGPSNDLPILDGPYYHLSVLASDGLASDEIFFYKQDSRAPFEGDARFGTSVLTYALSSLAANIDLYAVSEGQVFADSSLAGTWEARPSLVQTGLSVPWVSVAGQPSRFYLGLRTHGGDVAAPWHASLGWLLFENSATQGLTLLSSHLAYDARSIVIGQVPESSAWTLASIGLLVVGALARRQPRQA